MPTKTIASDATIRLIPGTSRYSVGYTCPKCGCDDWYKLPPARQVTLNRTKYGCRTCTIDKKAKYHAENADKVREQKASYYAENVDKVREKNARWRAANADKVRERKAHYYAENADKVREINARYRAANPHIQRAKVAKRRATKLNATPYWLTDKDITRIKKIYEDCPSGYQVDHILPLQGKRMCGLHVPSNLKAIPASENSSKCNREPDWTKKFQPGLHP